MKLLAQLVSVLLNPFVIFLTVPYVVVYAESKDSIYSLKWSGFSLLFFTLVGLFLLYGVKRGFFSDFDVSKRPQRALLYLYVGLISFVYLITVVFLNGPQILLITVISTLLGIFVASIINMRVKASIHIATLSSYVLSLSILYDKLFLAGLLLVPLLGWSRIILKKHTLSEVITGFLLGLSLALMVYFVVKYFLY